MRFVKALILAALVAAAPAGAAGPEAVDASVRPGDDFYRYANGAWLAATPLPPGRTSYDTTAKLRAQAAERVSGIVQAAAAQAPGASRIGDYYASFMDEAGIEAKGTAPLAAELAAIASIADSGALASHLGRSLRTDDGSNSQTDGLLGVWVHQGFHDPDRYVPHLVQGGLGLGDRDAYLDPSPARAAARGAYRARIAWLLALAGFDAAETRADRVLALETAIAASHASRADTDDVFKTDNLWRPADFAAKAPGLDWPAFFQGAGLQGRQTFIVWQPSAVTGAAALVRDQPLAAWKDYLAFHLIAHAAGVLPKAFRDPAAPDRAQKAITATTAALSDDIGRLYVARYFRPQAKAAAQAMAEGLRAAFRARIANLTWMSPAQRQMALAKLAALNIGIGYPNHWTDYAGLTVRRGDAYGNQRRAEAFAYSQALAKLARPVDPGEWNVVPAQSAGALLNFSPNAMQFAAGLLQPPFFDPGGDAAANYGSAGAGMAHEISHSFDKLGNIYDARGRLVGWWTPADLARYRAAAAPLAAQLAAYCVKPDLCLNSQQVLGESIGDLAGLLVAHDAYLAQLHDKPDVIKNGQTGEQRFFLAFARRWRRVQTDAALATQIAADTHPPGPYRAAMVRNLDAWQRAFEVKPGDRLHLPPDQRVRIW